MQEHDTKKLDHIIITLADLVATFGARFDKIDERLADHGHKFDTIADRLLGVENKVSGLDRRLDAEAIQRSELNLPRRVHDLEEEVYGRARSRHPKHLPL